MDDDDNDDDDFALADSFINFDYATAYSPTTLDNNLPDLPTHLDLTVRNSGVQERFQSFSLVENQVNEIENSNVDNAVEFGAITGDIIANDDQNSQIRGQNEIIINGDVNEIESESTTEFETESESESSSSSSSSSESEDYGLEEGEIVDSDGNDSEDGTEEITSWGIHDDQSQGRSDSSRNDLENLPRVPPVNVNLGPHHKMLPVGVVTSIVGAKVIVEGVEKHVPLNEGSILWITERQTPLGLIDEIFGQVTSPYYVVRYNSENEVPEGIHEGTLVSFVAEFVNHVLDDKDLYEKGYDEMSDEVEFSDDEKEAEYKRRQKQNKRGPNNRNPETMENNRKKVPINNVSILTMPVVPAAPLVAHGHCRPTMPGTRQDFFGAAHGHSSSLSCTGQGFSLNPPFPPVNGGPNLFTNGVLTNGVPLPPQQPTVPANGFPTNGVSWHPENTQFSHPLPTQGIPFQPQFNTSHRLPPPNVYPGGQPNMHAEPMYAQRPMNQNQQPPFPQFQAPANFHPSSISGNQGGPPNQFNPPTNFHSNSFPGNQGCLPNQFNPPTNFHSSSISGNQGGPPNQFNLPTNFYSNSFPGNQHPPQFHNQFNPGAHDGRGRTFGRGRRPFHRGGKGWRPAR